MQWFNLQLFIMARIFISYKRKDKALVFPVKDKIEEALGESCWIDLDGIESDAQFASVIIKAIKEAEVFLFMYSSNHAIIDDYENDWTIKELNFAKAKKKRIVFVKLDSTELSDWFEFEFPQKQLVDINDDDCFNRLINDIKTWLKIEVRNILSTMCDEPVLYSESFVLDGVGLSVDEILTLGNKYYEERNYEEAVRWYRKAAKQGNADAQYRLGFLAGWGLGIDFDEAEKWMYKAAEQGHVDACNEIGRWEESVDDYKASIKWYRMASEKGNADATGSLAEFYEYGLGVEKNLEEAEQLYIKAVALGGPYEQYELARFYERAGSVEKSIKWYQNAAEEGCHFAQLWIAVNFERQNNYEDAIKWYGRSAKQDNAEAQYALGRCFECGNGIAKDEIEAVKWYRKAAEQGDEEAKAALERLGEKK